ALVATHDAGFARALRAEPFTVGGGAVRPGWPPVPAWPARAPAPDAPQPLLRARGLVVRRGRRTVLSGLDLSVGRGETVAVLGPSGCGKTTLLAALAGLVRPAAGTIECLGGRRPQLLFQDAYASLTPGRTLRALARETARRGMDVAALAGALGLPPEVLDRSAAALSGGQRRRAALLRALTVQPSVLLLDEPTASLDAQTAAATMATVLGAAAGHAAATVLVTHDEDLAHALAHRVLRLED